MKKIFKTMLALMAGAMVFTACSSDDDLENISGQKTSALKPMTFYASMEGQGGGMRTVIDGLDIKWVYGDKITLFDGENVDGNLAREFTLTSDPGSTSGTFEGTAAEGAEVYYALYPNVISTLKEVTLTTDEEVAKALGYGESDMNTLREWYSYGEAYFKMCAKSFISTDIQEKLLAYFQDGNFITTEETGVQRNSSDQFENVVLPAVQTVSEGQFVDPKAMLMIGKSNDKTSIGFKNVCAYVKVTPAFNCKTICLKSNGSESLAGTVTVDYNEGTPTTTVTANGSNKIELTGTITANNTYYIAVRPETLASGFTIEFLTSDQEYYYQRTTSKDPSLERNKVTNLGTFEATSKWTINTATHGSDGNGHEWILLSPTLKMATAAVSADGVLRSDAEGLWGADWVLPAKEADLRPLGNLSYGGNSITMKGIGILRDIKNTVTANITDSWSASIWTSETKPTCWYNNGFWFPEEGDKAIVLYKYIGE